MNSKKVHEKKKKMEKKHKEFVAFVKLLLAGEFKAAGLSRRHFGRMNHEHEPQFSERDLLALVNNRTLFLFQVIAALWIFQRPKRSKVRLVLRGWSLDLENMSTEPGDVENITLHVSYYQQERDSEIPILCDGVRSKEDEEAIIRLFFFFFFFFLPLF